MTELKNDMTYEEAFAALKETVAVLEDPKTSLDESLALYERACKLVVFCQRRLTDAKQEVTDINARIAEMKKNQEEIF